MAYVINQPTTPPVPWRPLIGTVVVIGVGVGVWAFSPKSFDGAVAPVAIPYEYRLSETSAYHHCGRIVPNPSGNLYLDSGMWFHPSWAMPSEDVPANPPLYYDIEGFIGDDVICVALPYRNRCACFAIHHGVPLDISILIRSKPRKPPL
jgi:hypothetical protein